MNMIAPLSRRFSAAMSTCVLIVVWLLFSVWFFSFPLPLSEILRRCGAPFLVARWLPPAIVFGIPSAWYVLDGAVNRATYGMRRARIRFCSIDFSEAAFEACLLRLMAGVLTMPISPILGLAALFDSRRRTLVDLVSGIV